MALTGLLLLELCLYASCFVCGIVTAASVTIVQVIKLRNQREKHRVTHSAFISVLFRVDSLVFSAC